MGAREEPAILESDRMRVALLPNYGARVISLVDKTIGRDWIAKGPLCAETGDDAPFLADQAAGWDECFPTVAPCDARATSWGRRLRDHGELWGRPWRVVERNESEISTVYANRDFAFQRALKVTGASLECVYSVENLGREAMPFVWAMHGLLAVSPADSILLPGVESLEATYLSLRDERLSFSRLEWPGASAVLPFDLDRVQDAKVGFAGKFYAPAKSDPAASVGDRRSRLDFGWDVTAAPSIGLWLNYGGWPIAGDIHHIAIEATTAAADDLAQAIDRGLARSLPPGKTSSWSLTLTVRPS
jgi:galactose mutarotase-like enzyme